ncbi:MAG: MarR family transcriptional regulator [Schumannella sp.]
MASHELEREAEYNVSQRVTAFGIAVLPVLFRGQPLAKVAHLGGLTPVLDRLEGRGLVQREPDGEDRRRLKVRLTPEGKAA